MKTKMYLTIYFAVCMCFFGNKVEAQDFRAAVVKIDITPQDAQLLSGYNPRTSTGVLDRIYHKIVALDDGNNKFLLISTDIVSMSPAEYDKIAGQLEQKFGIDPLNVWWSATHTHSAPIVAPQFQRIPFPSMANRTKLTEQYAIDTTYTAMLEQALIEGVNEALDNLEPARLGVGWGYSQANINRRAIDVDGKASLGLNPDGAVDRRIGLIRIEKQNGDPLVLIANYPIHGTVLGQGSLEISGDAPGVVSEYVEKHIGAPVLFINGAAGNLAPIYSVYPNPRAGHLSQFRVLLGDRILEANSKISSTVDSVKLAMGSLTVETPRKEDLGWSSDLNNYTRTTSGGVNMVLLPIRFIKFNEELAIWSAPLELFCEISNEIRDRSPFPYTFYFGYTNGSLGYLPTEEAWEEEGYETSVSPFTPAASRDLIEAVVAYLERETGSKAY